MLGLFLGAVSTMGKRTLHRGADLVAIVAHALGAGNHHVLRSIDNGPTTQCKAGR